MFRRSFVFLAVSAVLTLSLVRCGDDDGAAAGSNALSVALGSVAVSSPSAGTSTSSTSISSVSSGTYAVAAEEVPLKKLKDQVDEIKNLANSKDGATAAAGIKLNLKAMQNNCYGQQQNYTNHPDGGGSGQVLGGDGLIQSELENLPGGVNVACPAATLNSKVGHLSGLVNQGMKMVAAVLAQLNAEGKSLPTTEGESVTVASLVIPGLTVTAATLTKGADLTGGFTTYTTSISGTITAHDTNGPFEIVMTNSRKSDTVMKGKMRGVMKHPQGNEFFAFSLVYDVNETTTGYALKSAETRNHTDATTAPDIFDANGLLNFGYANDMQNMVYFIASLGTSSGLGDAIFAWNAGKQDPRARVFQVHTEAGANGAQDTGTAHAGFGPPVNATNEGNSTLGNINGMICFWVGSGPNAANAFLGGNNAAELNGQYQRMAMSRSATSGEFEPVTGQVNIAYCPTASCNGAGGGFTVDSNACTAAHSLSSSYTRLTVPVVTYP